jgi:pimeloyl-ACP methyl ester carboxylesterase
VHVPETVVDVAGHPTVVRRAGSGRPLLYLHGAFFPTRWLPFHDRLGAHADVIAPLHPGYREGGPPDWLRGFDDLVLHYHDLLDVLDLERVDVVGYDLGGWLAAQLSRFYPERVRSLTLVSASGLRMPDAPMFEFLAADPRRVIDALFNGEPGEHAADLPNPADVGSFVEAYGENGVTARLIWERRYDHRLDRRSLGLRMPSLVITPDDDRVVPVAHAHRWAELLPDSRLVTLAGVGHALVVQAPDELSSAIATFLSEVPA